MAVIREFVPRVQAFARMCPVTILKDEVLRAITDLCNISGVWKHTSVNDLVAGVDSYTLNVPVGASPGWIESVAVSGSPLLPLPGDWPQAEAQAGSPAVFTLNHLKALRLFPAPSVDAPGALVVNLNLEPAYDADSVPDFLFQHHREAVVSGALGSVLGMVGQPWANPSLALYHIKNFKSEIAKVRIATLKSSTIGRLEMTSNPI